MSSNHFYNLWDAAKNGVGTGTRQGSIISFLNISSISFGLFSRIDRLKIHVWSSLF